MVLARLRNLTALSTLTAVAILALPAPSAPAQCFGPDLLDIGPCCAPALPNLPLFPPVAIPGGGICWNTCTAGNPIPLRLEWTPPAQVICGEYTTALTVRDAAGVPQLVGTLVLDYTRTWDEIDPAGLTHQVWRFAAKADLSGVPGVPPHPCVVPSCIAPIGPHSTAFYYGYVDYAGCLAVGPNENALVLYHACDRFIHMAGLSNRPGTFHPGTSYGLVAPHSPAQPFIPMNLIAPTGPLVAEATRNVAPLTLPPSLCFVEDRVVGGALSPLGAGCICTFTTLPKQQSMRQFTGTTFCTNAAGVSGGWASLAVSFPTLPWMHMVTTSIGSWSMPGVYPGKESAWVDEGLFVHSDPCNGDFIEMKYGGSTRDGWLAMLGGLVTTTFTDLTDNYTAPLFGPYPLPLLGSVQPTDHLVYVNVP